MHPLTTTENEPFRFIVWFLPCKLKVSSGNAPELMSPSRTKH